MDRTCCTTLCTCPALPGLPYCKRCADDAVEMGLLSPDDIQIDGGAEKQGE